MRTRKKPGRVGWGGLRLAGLPGLLVSGTIVERLSSLSPLGYLRGGISIYRTCHLNKHDVE